MSARFPRVTPPVFAAAIVAACGGSSVSPPSAPPGGASPAGGGRARGATFAEDVAFLRQYGPVQVLEGARGARVAVSAKYQGRVMTSAIAEDGESFGWIHRDFVASGKTGTHFDNYGGEDRFWLGPEAGQFGLYFAPGAPFEVGGWQVPPGLQEGAWDLVEGDGTHAVLRRALTLRNGSGAEFALTVDRTIRLLDAPAADGVRSVSFESVNRITNTGKAPWKKETGLLSIWILGMYAPASDTRVVIPFATDGVAAGTPVVNDAYFGKVPAERLTVREDQGFLLFACDGKLRSKIGVGPARAKPSLGSYSAEAQLLTVVEYDKGPAGAPYVNSLWEHQSDPYAGDVVNSYNDGPSEPGKPPLGGFFELETSSPAAELAPGQSTTFTQRTHHFVGAPEALEPLAVKLLGVSLRSVAGAPR